MNYETLRGRYVLLDTNVVINIGRYLKFYQNLIDSLFEHDVVLLINPIVKAELFAFVKTDSDAEKVTKLINILSNDKPDDSLMPFTNNIDYAIKLGRKYQELEVPVKHIQLPDLLIGAELARYQKGGHLFLATEDHSGFPVPIYKRHGIETIDCGQSIHTVGFYNLSEEL